jgi:DNA-binding response OmpR family regulator
MNPLADDPLDVLFASEDAELAEMYRMKLELDGYLVRGMARDEEWPPAGWRPDIAYFEVGDGEDFGARTHRRLRSDATTYDVPAIVLSRLSLRELDQRGFALGPQDYLVKLGEPFHLNPSVERLSSGLALPLAARD